VSANRADSLKAKGANLILAQATKRWRVPGAGAEGQSVAGPSGSRICLGQGSARCRGHCRARGADKRCS
jgi:hypothetical protein